MVLMTRLLDRWGGLEARSDNRPSHIHRWTAVSSPGTGRLREDPDPTSREINLGDRTVD